MGPHSAPTSATPETKLEPHLRAEPGRRVPAYTLRTKATGHLPRESFEFMRKRVATL